MVWRASCTEEVSYPDATVEGMAVRSVEVFAAAFAACHSEAGIPISIGVAARCAHCGAYSAEGDRVGSVVSRSFSAYDSWFDFSADRLCRKCVWLFTTGYLRSSAYSVTTAPTMQILGPKALSSLLSTPIGVDTAVIVPLRGRKHLLASARWGAITVDDATVPWDRSAVAAVEVIHRLRAAGFGVKELRQQTPAYQRMRTIPPNLWAQVLSDWKSLEPWRARGPWWELLVRASPKTRTDAQR